MTQGLVQRTRATIPTSPALPRRETEVGCTSHPGDRLLALLTWSDGHRNRSCVARLLDVGYDDAELVAFGDPPAGARVRIAFLDSTSSVTGVVSQRREEVSGADHSVRVAVRGEGWRGIRTGSSARRVVLSGRRGGE